MTLTELLDCVFEQGGISPTRLKDFKTSIRYLAKALDTPDPNQCPDHLFLTPGWKDKLNHYFGACHPPVSAHTIRNTRNHLSKLFREAKSLGIFSQHPVISKPLMRRPEHLRLMWATSPYKEHARQPPYGLPIEQWPFEIREAWQHYCAKRSLAVRPTTLEKIKRHLQFYLGFAHHIEHLPLTTWDHLFNPARLDRFVRWHSQKLGARISTHAYGCVKILLQLASYYKHANTQALQDYYRELPTPEPMHNKQLHWFTLLELEHVGLSLLEDARKPISTTSYYNRTRPGLMRALLHEKALILRLLVRVPLRQRNVRELKLNRNLYQDQTGQWHLEFKGNELKISHRRGKMNVFHLNLHQHAPELIPHLEEFVHVQRPKLPHADTSPYVFLTRTGQPFTVGSLRHELVAHVYARTNKRFYPHLIRTLWATEFIAKTGDFTTAAYMLNDRVETVIQQYQEILDKDHQHKAHAFLATVLGT